MTRHVIYLRDGSKVEASTVRLDGGWVHAEVMRWRIIENPDGCSAHRAADGTVSSHYPVSNVRRVVDVEVPA